MLNKLRRRFVAISMLAFALVILLVSSVLCIVYITRTNRELDIKLTLIAENGGDFPPLSQIQNSEYGKYFAFTEETRLSTRYFSVGYNNNGRLQFINILAIASVSYDDAVSMSRTVMSDEKSSERGWLDSYRYYLYQYSDGSVLAVFIDASNNLMMVNSLLLYSALTSVISLAIVFVLLVLFSKRAMRPVAENYEKQKQFITDAGHELKTPITVISATSEILEMTYGDDEWVTTIKEQTAKLSRMVRDLVTLARIEETEDVTVKYEFDCSMAAQDTVSGFDNPALLKDKTMTVDISSGIKYNGNERDFRQIVSILTENAVKYCDDGGEIKVSLRQERSVYFTVENSYKMAEAINTDRLFDRFYRSDEMRGSLDGHGLGLAIARTLSQKDGYNISVSARDQKVIFTLRLDT